MNSILKVKKIVRLADPLIQCLEINDELWAFTSRDQLVEAFRFEPHTSQFMLSGSFPIENGVRRILWKSEGTLIYVDFDHQIHGASAKSDEVSLTGDGTDPKTEDFRCIGWEGNLLNYWVRMIATDDNFAPSYWRMIFDQKTRKVNWSYGFQWNSQIQSPTLASVPSLQGHTVQFNYQWSDHEKLEVSTGVNAGRLLLTQNAKTLEVGNEIVKVKCGAGGFTLNNDNLIFFDRFCDWKPYQLDTPANPDLGNLDSFCLTTGLVTHDGDKFSVYSKLN